MIVRFIDGAYTFDEAVGMAKNENARLPTALELCSTKIGTGRQAFWTSKTSNFDPSLAFTISYCHDPKNLLHRKAELIPKTQRASLICIINV